MENENIILDENGVENMEGHHGTPVEGAHAVGFGRPEPKEPIRFEDFGKIAAELAAAEGTPNYQVLLQDYTGPDTGVTYDDETKTCHVAAGFTIKDGIIVPED